MSAESSPQGDSSLAQEALQALWRQLKDQDSSVRLTALHETSKLATTTKPILQQVERIALDDPVPENRRAASEILDNPVHRLTYAKMTTLSPSERAIVRGEIGQWSQQGLLSPELTKLLRRRYEFDMTPLQPKPPPAKVAAPDPTPTVAPQPSLMQSLLGETSINVALYLGAFFVIGAALVLSALVEAARLPILATVTVLFGFASWLLAGRLPRPSFVLFLVFSTLIPIDASVVASQLHLEGTSLAAYWGLVFGMTAALWAFSTHRFSSRLLSLAAFVSLELSALSFGIAADAIPLVGPIPAALVLCSLAAVGGVLGAARLNRWRGRPFARPLLVLSQATQVILLGAGFCYIFMVLIESPFTNLMPLDWALLTAVWVVGAIFFFLSNRYFRNDLFPFAVIGALVPVVFTALNSVVDPASAVQWLANWAWGTMLLVSGELIRDTPAPEGRRYANPMVLGSAAAFCLCLVLACANAFELGSTTPIFVVLVGTAVAYASVNWYRPRWYFWSAVLGTATAAWLLVVTLPLMEGTTVFYGYVLASIGLILLGIDLALPASFKPNKAWHLPPRVLGTGLTCITFIPLIAGWGSETQAGTIFAVFGLFFTAYALCIDVRIGYVATASLALAATAWALVWGSSSVGPALTMLSTAFFLSGLLLRRRQVNRWGDVLRFSGLALGGFAALAVLVMRPAGAGWYMLVISLPWILDLFIFGDRWAEIPIIAALSMAAGLLLYEQDVTSATYYAASIGVLVLGLDLVFNRRGEPRPDKGITAIVVGGSATACAVALMLTMDVTSAAAALVSSCLTAFSVAWVYLRRDARLGYLPASLLALSFFFALEYLDQTTWPWPLILLASGYYIAASLLRGPSAKVLRISGLALGALVSLGAWLVGIGLGASVVVALAATLFAAEAVGRRNAWLALPANVLYLGAYFMILAELQVDEPQFYSLAVGALGLLMHYLLLRSGSPTGAIVIGFASQFVLLGTTYVQLVMTELPVYFTILFLEALVVLAYGVVIRSRSLVISAIGFSTLGVATVVYGILRGLSVVILIGCTGMLLILLGTAALLLRERAGTWRRRLEEWNA